MPVVNRRAGCSWNDTAPGGRHGFVSGVIYALQDLLTTRVLVMTRSWCQCDGKASGVRIALLGALRSAHLPLREPGAHSLSLRPACARGPAH